MAARAVKTGAGASDGSATSYWTTDRATCRLCGDAWDAGREALAAFTRVPIAGAYVPADPAQFLQDNSYAPLTLLCCPGCGLVQLREMLAPAFYRQYGFAGGLGSAYRAYLAQLADFIAARVGPGATVLEAGCGDGTLLKRLEERCLTVSGFEPARFPREQARAMGLKVSASYLTAQTWAQAGIANCDVVILRHVLEHVDDFAAIFSGIEAAAKPDGHLIIEVPDLAATVRQGLFGNIYHPHACYFDVQSLARLLEKFSWEAAPSREVPIFGGSLLLAAKRKGQGSPVDMDPWPLAGKPDAALLGPFASDWSQFSKNLATFVRERRAEGLTVAGYGAGERTASLIGAAGVGAADLSCLYDKNSHLQGKALAGARIPIRSPGEIAGDMPAVMIVFAQSHECEIVEELHAFRSEGGRVAVLRRHGPVLLE